MGVLPLQPPAKTELGDLLGFGSLFLFLGVIGFQIGSRKKTVMYRESLAKISVVEP